MIENHCLDLIDGQRPIVWCLVLSKMYVIDNKESPALVVSSGLRFPLSKVNFVMGKVGNGWRQVISRCWWECGL